MDVPHYSTRFHVGTGDDTRMPNSSTATTFRFQGKAHTILPYLSHLVEPIEECIDPPRIEGLAFSAGDGR